MKNIKFVTEFFLFRRPNSLLKKSHHLSPFTFHLKKGFTLIEAMVSLAILMIVIPIIYQSFFNTQKYLLSANVQSDIELENHTAMMNISKDIKESVIIFERDLNGIDEFKNKFIPDAVTDTQFTKKDASEGSAILLMKYIGDTKVNFSGSEKNLGMYRIVCYYMTLLPSSSNFYTPSIKIRSVTRLSSTQIFLDQAFLNKEEQDIARKKEFLLWERPKRAFIPVFPDISQMTATKNKFTFSTAPGNTKIDGNISSKAGGMKFVQNGNKVSITLLGIRKAPDGIKSISLNSVATAVAYIM